MHCIETIEAQFGRQANDINAVSVLSKWYGPASLVCHLVRPIDSTTLDAFFVVGQNICGSAARPPMFDRLSFENGQFNAPTSMEDAKEHFIETVGKGVVPGHNLAGLAIEVATLAFNKERGKRADLMVTGFDYIRFKNLVLPSHELDITGTIEQGEKSIQFSPVINYKGSKRLLGKNLRLEVATSFDVETQKTLLAQHWLLEIIAQGLGVGATALGGKEGVLPIFYEIGRGEFAPMPIRAGNILRTHIEFKNLEDTVLGNASIFVEHQQIARLEEVLLGFLPIEKVFPKDADQKGQS